LHCICREMDNKGQGKRGSLYYRTCLACLIWLSIRRRGKIVLIQVGNFRRSATKYCYRQGENSVLPTSPDEYRTRHASSGSLEFLRIPHTWNLGRGGATGTSVSVGHIVQTGFVTVRTWLWGHMWSFLCPFWSEYLES
jgi:hypothetical protein